MDDKDKKIERLRFINGLMRKLLEHFQQKEAEIGIRPTEFPDFVYEYI